MKVLLTKVAITTTTTASILVTASASMLSAQAASFTPFKFQTNFTTSGVLDPANDILLNSVVINGHTVDQFALVNQVEVISNDAGLIDAVHGLNNPQDPLVGEGPSVARFPTGADLAATLGNLNLNSLINGREDPGQVVLDVFFEHPQQTFLFWERGGAPGSGITGNSDLNVAALSDDGQTVLASYRFLRTNWVPAGFSVQSTIVPNAPIQNMGSLGLQLEGAASRRLQISFSNPEDFGPDVKVVATPVPEPSTIVGSLVLGGVFAAFKRKQQLRKAQEG